MVVGPIIIRFISELLISSFSGIFGMVSSWFGGINLASLFLLYPMIFDNLPKILLGHFSSIHFQFLLTLMIYFSILLSVSSALSPDIF